MAEISTIRTFDPSSKGIHGLPSEALTDLSLDPKAGKMDDCILTTESLPIDQQEKLKEVATRPLLSTPLPFNTSDAVHEIMTLQRSCMNQQYEQKSETYQEDQKAREKLHNQVHENLKASLEKAKNASSWGTLKDAAGYLGGALTVCAGVSLGWSVGGVALATFGLFTLAEQFSGSACKKSFANGLAGDDADRQQSYLQYIEAGHATLSIAAGIGSGRAIAQAGASVAQYVQGGMTALNGASTIGQEVNQAQKQNLEANSKQLEGELFQIQARGKDSLSEMRELTESLKKIADNLAQVEEDRNKTLESTQRS